MGGYRYAKSLNPSRIYILSAKYGLLNPETVITPYNQTLNGATDIQIKRWSFKVYQQLIKSDVNFDEETVFLCGANYRKYLQKLFRNSIAPLSHMGIGEQLRFYKQNGDI